MAASQAWSEHANTAECEALVERTQELADLLAERSDLGLQTAPEEELRQCKEIGLLTAPLPRRVGGLGLGSEPGGHAALMRLLTIVGSADLALGRLYEGHVNGLLLVARYGTAKQMQNLADCCHGGMLSGVWNTGQPELLKLLPAGTDYRFEGMKTFATGAAFVKRPIVTAEIPGKGWQMTIPRMESLSVSIDRGSWHPLGMESSESFNIDFTGGVVREDELIGIPGDFYRDPMFRGGAIRFAAVQAGAILRLLTTFAAWLDETRRGEDPYQIARLGEIAIAGQEAVLWIERAGAIAEQSFGRTEKIHIDRMVHFADMTRLAIERRAISVMQLIVSGVGAHGLLQPRRFGRIIRDLTMYLRQPAPDHTLANVGRFAMEKRHRITSENGAGFWNGEIRFESLPPTYFEQLYDRESDPWNFATSDYEREKYQVTVASFPKTRYLNGLEVGCSIGVLTQSIGTRCDQLLSVDVSEKALELARERSAEMPHIQFMRMQIPKHMPDLRFDLIVVSEVGYYWERRDLECAASKLATAHLPGGHLILVHLIEKVYDYPLTGDEVHEYWLRRPEWRPIHQFRHERYRLDVLERIADAESSQ